jgi:hypothetical protein
MIVLQDTVTIHVPPARIWNWLESLPEHVHEWHPDHISARWLSGGAFVLNAEMEVRERLHGKLHRLRIAVTEVKSGHWVRYRIFPGLRGGFKVEPVESGSRFTATIEFGTGIPVIGKLIDGVLRLVIPGRLEAIQRHQAEEGARLKELLEAVPWPRGPNPPLSPDALTDGAPVS